MDSHGFFPVSHGISKESTSNGIVNSFKTPSNAWRNVLNGSWGSWGPQGGFAWISHGFRMEFAWIFPDFTWNSNGIHFKWLCELF